MDIDKVDKEILVTMQADGRTTMARLAEVVHLSETPCLRRLKRLESDGIIEQYRAILSRSALGLGIHAFAFVRFDVHTRGQSDKFEREIEAIPRIIACYNISGTADYLLEVVSRNMDEYGMFMRDVLRTLPGVTSVESMFCMREVKKNAGFPVL